MTWALAALALALVIFAWVQVKVVPGSRFWTDELYTIWASDPRLSAYDSIIDRVLRDTAPPLYISMMWFVRQVVAEGRLPFMVLNAIGAAVFIPLTLVLARRAKAPALGVTIVAAFLTGALALCYASEGRNYFWIFNLSMALGVLVGGVVTGQPVRRFEYVAAGIMGALAVWLHLFGAFFVGALAAALVVVGFLVMKRGDVVRLGLTIGVSALVATAVWLAAAIPMIEHTADTGFWIEFNKAEIVASLWIVKQYTVGLTAMLGVGALVGLLALLDRRMRPMVLIVGLTLAVFAAIPLLVSLRLPIIQGRYFLVGVPALMAMLSFMWRDALMASRAERLPSRRTAVAFLGALFLVSPSITGPATTFWHFAGRWDWRGADVIEPYVEACRGQQIRVLNSSMGDPYGFGFGIYLRGRASFFNAETAPQADVADLRCPVVAWAEHYHPNLDRTWVNDAPIDQVLAAFHLTNRRNLPLKVERHNGGLTVIRDDGAPTR
jgi:hypothetical protein